MTDGKPSRTSTKESSTAKTHSYKEVLEEEYQRRLGRGQDPNSHQMQALRQEILLHENRELKSRDPEYQRWLIHMGGPH